MKLKNIFLCITAIIISIGIYACNKETDNPIQPQPSGEQIDSSRFDWKQVEIPYSPSWFESPEPWMSDTDEVFLIPDNKTQVFHYKSGNYSYIDFPSNVELTDIRGISAKEGYLFGRINKEGISSPYFQKWDGNTFHSIPVNVISDKKFIPNGLHPTFVRNSNEMWISSAKGINWKFDGYNLTPYTLPDSIVTPGGFYYKNNRLKFLYYYDNFVDTTETAKVCEFDGQNWNIVYERTYSIIYPPEIPWYNYYIIGNSLLIQVVNPTTYELYELNENNTLSFIHTTIRAGSNIIFDIQNPIAGYPPDNLLCYSIAPLLQNTQIAHWNGVRVSAERPFFNTSNYNNEICNLNGTTLNSDYFCLHWTTHPIFHKSYLYFGKRKNIKNLK